MKRSPMPRRLVPLERRTRLESRTSLKRGGRLNPIGRKAKREAADLRAFRRALKARAGGACEARVHPQCTGVGADAHHRCPADRDRDQHDPARGMWLCRWCHGWVHAHPARSYEWGFLLRDDGGGAA